MTVTWGAFFINCAVRRGLLGQQAEFLYVDTEHGQLRGEEGAVGVAGLATGKLGAGQADYGPGSGHDTFPSKMPLPGEAAASRSVW